MTTIFTAVIERDLESGLYVGTVPGLCGAHSQGATLDELQTNLREVLELIIEEHDSRGQPLDLSCFVGVQQIAIDR